MGIRRGGRGGQELALDSPPLGIFFSIYGGPFCHFFFLPEKAPHSEFCLRAFNFGATLLYDGDFSQKLVQHRVTKKLIKGRG